MIFGSIEYLNLLPFRIFLKKHLKGNATYQALHYKGGVPSKINQAFRSRRIDAAFISSIASKRSQCSNLGIIAHKEVRSVFVIPHTASKTDTASATSNRLAQILGVEGEVIIGDRALKYYLDGNKVIDLASLWYEKYQLPFVFARLCYHNHAKQLQDIIKKFRQSPKKIPQYILKKEAIKRGIEPKEIQEYLHYIEYKIDYRAKRSFKLFLSKSRKVSAQSKR